MNFIVLHNSVTAIKKRNSAIWTKNIVDRGEIVWTVANETLGVCTERPGHMLALLLVAQKTTETTRAVSKAWDQLAAKVLRQKRLGSS